MELYELVFLRNELEKSIDLSTIKLEVEKNQSKLINLLHHCNDSYKQDVMQVIDNHGKIFDHGIADINQVKTTIEKINSEISLLTKKFFAANYQTELQFKNPERIREAKIIVVEEYIKEILRNRIFFHSTWEYPALEIGCRDGEWTKHLVSFDPLYISDLFDEFLFSSAEQFPAEYKNRLRKYKLSLDYTINNLPKNQFGFIFSYNFFNYLSLDSIKRLLLQSMEWLKPGGSMIFTYNNADLSASAGMCSDYFMSYVPKSMLVPLIESIGFEITDLQDHLPSTSWVEIRKPGTLTTVKAHQALGEIKYTSV